MEDENFIAIVLGIPVVIVLSRIAPIFIQAFTNINNYIVNNIFYILEYVLIAGYIVFTVYYLIRKMIIKSRKRKEEIKNNSEEIKSVLNEDIKRYSSDQLEEYSIRLNHVDRLVFEKIYFKFKDSLILKQKELQNRIIEEEHREKIEYYHEREKDTLDRLEVLEKRERELEQTREEKKKRIKQELDLIENNVFKKEDLSKSQIKVLLEERYSQINEYCVYEKKMVTVFVKPTMNHTKTHTFLVWSTMELLDKIPGVENVLDHDTVEADITFNYKKNKYAIETETGNLFRKKVQKTNKFRYLNRKFKDSWIVIVSNRNLLADYRKFGPATDRKGAAEKIKKMLRN